MSITSQQMNYYKADDLINATKIILPVHFKCAEGTIESDVSCTIDTGAIDVVINAANLNLKLSEKEFVQKYKVKPINRVGINRQYPLRYYRYIVDEIQLGDIVLHKFPIYITFEKYGTSKLLGMSFLRLFEVTIKPQYKDIYFKATSETEDDIKNDRPFNNIETKYLDTLIDLGEFDIDSTDEQTLEANVINKKLNT